MLTFLKPKEEQGTFLTESDYKVIAPYLKGVINLECKEYPGKVPVKEVLLEYADGKKMIGNLYSKEFRMQQLKGLTSIQSYFARGKYGSNQYRGNCSGLLIKDLIEHYQPGYIVDPMVGYGTTYEVASDLGIECLALDLNPKWGAFDALTMELPRSSKFIFWHPPYFVFSGSHMPKYSGLMWGNSKHPSDGSHIHDPELFTKWFNKVQANLYQALRKDGRLCILMGDSRYKGKYYSMFKAMDIYGMLEGVIVKRQFNCVSDNIQYRGKYIPLEHEYLVIIRKDHEFEIKCMLVKNVTTNILKSKKVTWRALIQSAIEYCGGHASRQDILDILKNHPKAENNNHLAEKIRQTINLFADEFIKNANGTIALAA